MSYRMKRKRFRITGNIHGNDENKSTTVKSITMGQAVLDHVTLIERTIGDGEVVLNNSVLAGTSRRDMKQKLLTPDVRGCDMYRMRGYVSMGYWFSEYVYNKGWQEER